MIKSKVLFPDIYAIVPALAPTRAKTNTIAIKIIASLNPAKPLVSLCRLRTFNSIKPSNAPTLQDNMDIHSKNFILDPKEMEIPAICPMPPAHYLESK